MVKDGNRERNARVVWKVKTGNRLKKSLPVMRRIGMGLKERDHGYLDEGSCKS